MTDTVIEDGVYEETVDDSAELANALLAGGGPLRPPREWFEHPNLTKPTPITVTADGRIYGHIASFETSHIGIPGARKPPRSRHDYAFFKTGVLETAEGDEVAVGQLTLAGGHAPLNADAGAAARHYDDTSSAVADVTVGEDIHGIWISGGVRPGVEDTAIRALRASAPSGDWRPINNNLELVAICQVNVPGFPVARAMVAGGEMISLVAAGASDMYRRRLEFATQASVDELRARLTQFEDSLTAAGTEDETEDHSDLDFGEVRLMDIRERLDAVTASMSARAWAKIGSKVPRVPEGVSDKGGEFTDKPSGGKRARPKLPSTKAGVAARKKAARAKVGATEAETASRAVT